MLFHSKVVLRHHGKEEVTHNKIMTYGYQYFFDRLFKQRLPSTWYLGIISNYVDDLHWQEYYSPRPLWNPIFLTKTHVGNSNPLTFILNSRVNISALFACDNKSNIFSVIKLPNSITFAAGESFTVIYEIFL